MAECPFMGHSFFVQKGTIMLQNPALAPTNFISGPEEDLATADVYEIKSDAVINNVKIYPISVDEVDLADELRGGVNSSLLQLPNIQSSDGTVSSDTPSSSDIAQWRDRATKMLSEPNQSSAPSSSDIAQWRDRATKMLSEPSQSISSWGSPAVSTLGNLSSLTNTAGPSVLSRLAGNGVTGIPGLNSSGLSSLTNLLGNSSLPSSVKGLLTSPIPPTLGSVASLGGIINRIAPNQITQSYQMGSLINNIVGGSSPMNIVDRDSSVRVISALAVGGMGSGLPNSFSAVASLAGNDKSILSAAATVALAYASKNGNVGGMKDVVSTVGVASIAAIGKEAITSLGRSYKNSPTTSTAPAQQVQQDFHDVTDTFNNINSTWMRDDRYTIDPDTKLPVMDFPVVDISMAREGSPAFANMMQQGALTSTDPDLKYFSMVNTFPATSPEQELKKNFPLTFTSINTSTTQYVSTLPGSEPRATTTGWKDDWN